MSIDFYKCHSCMCTLHTNYCCFEDSCKMSDLYATARIQFCLCEIVIDFCLGPCIIIKFINVFTRKELYFTTTVFKTCVLQSKSITGMLNVSYI